MKPRSSSGKRVSFIKLGPIKASAEDRNHSNSRPKKILLASEAKDQKDTSDHQVLKSYEESKTLTSKTPNPSLLNTPTITHLSKKSDCSSEKREKNLKLKTSSHKDHDNIIACLLNELKINLKSNIDDINKLLVELFKKFYNKKAHHHQEKKIFEIDFLNELKMNIFNLLNFIDKSSKLNILNEQNISSDISNTTNENGHVNDFYFEDKEDINLVNDIEKVKKEKKEIFKKYKNNLILLDVDYEKEYKKLCKVDMYSVKSEVELIENLNKNYYDNIIKELGLNMEINNSNKESNEQTELNDLDINNYKRLINNKNLLIIKYKKEADTLKDLLNQQEEKNDILTLQNKAKEKYFQDELIKNKTLNELLNEEKEKHKDYKAKLKDALDKNTALGEEIKNYIDVTSKKVNQNNESTLNNKEKSDKIDKIDKNININSNNAPQNKKIKSYKDHEYITAMSLDHDKNKKTVPKSSKNLKIEIESKALITEVNNKILPELNNNSQSIKLKTETNNINSINLGTSINKESNDKKGKNVQFEFFNRAKGLHEIDNYIANQEHYMRSSKKAKSFRLKQKRINQISTEQVEIDFDFGKNEGE